MPSLIVAAAAEVVTAINAGTYASPVTASRVYVDTNRLEDLGDLRVEVIPQDIERERAARKVWTRRGSVLVGILKRLPSAGKDAAADALLELSDAICRQIERYDFTVGALQAIDELTTWNRERYDKERVFTRALLLTFQLGASSNV